MIFNTKFKVVFLLFFFFFFFSTSCETESKGFVLPDGDKVNGKESFRKLHCNECHSVADIEWTGNLNELHIPLGYQSR